MSSKIHFAAILTSFVALSMATPAFAAGKIRIFAGGKRKIWATKYLDQQ
jgi:hypothetical protein